MKKNILLSIVCPVYNGEKTVGKFIDSLECQEYKNYELILVNDGSKDNTMSVLKEYEKKYKNIIAIDKKHSGVSETRNIGISKAQGKYITFGDCDDYYSKDYFAKIIPILQKENFELFYFNAYVLDKEQLIGNIIAKQYRSGSFTEHCALQKYMQGEFLHKLGSIPWNKIYLKKIIDEKKLQFNQNKKSGEDLLFNMSYVSKITNFLYLDEKLYYYRNDSDSSYAAIDLEENKKYFETMQEICLENHIENKEHFIGLFYLRKFLRVILNETNNKNYKNGKVNIQKYIKIEEIDQALKQVKFKNLDKKLVLAYLLYKYKLYKVVYCLLWHIKKK